MIEPALQAVLGGATFALSLKLTSDHSAETPWWRKLAGIGYGAFGLWLLGMLLSSTVPVVRDMEAAVLDRGENWVLMSVSATKPEYRRECEFLYTRANVVDAGGIKDKAWWEVLDDPTPGSTRPAGKQWMGEWRIKWTLRRGYTPVAVYLESHHRCGLLDGEIVTRTGPFPIQRPPEPGGK